jgi:hypothetical protein
MNNSTSISPLNCRLVLTGICLCSLAGCFNLYSVLVGDAHGLKAWFEAFGPWTPALIGYCAMRKLQKN